jgi:hypothetical protein
MARQTGARTQANLAFETVYGTAPVSGFRTIPFASTSLGAERPLIENEMLGFGRDPLAPQRDAITVDGDMVIPVDVENLGLWLKAAFGAPTTTGTTPKVHTFQSGAWALPSMALEVAMPEVPRYALYSGVMVNTLAWSMGRSGLLTGTVGLMAQKETIATVTAAGTPTALAYQRFGHFNGAITRDGSPLGSVISAEITYANNLDPVAVIRADGAVDGFDPMVASLSGSLVARFDSAALITQAISGAPCELKFAYDMGANAKFEFTAHAVYLPQPRTPIEGPGGVQVTFAWQAARAVSPARLCTAVLTNTVASY